MKTDIKLTKHGVRDLNGPRMDGHGHNGKEPSCVHFKAPDTATYSERTHRGKEYRCSLCGEVRWIESVQESEAVS